MKAVVLTFDCLPLRLLGCYGNETVATPNFDALAAESVVFDAHFGESFNSQYVEHAWWTGNYQFLRTHPGVRRSPLLVQRLAETGVVLSTIAEGDSPEFPAGFQRVFAGKNGADTLGGESAIDSFISAAEACLAEQISRGRESSLIWLNCRGIVSSTLSNPGNSSPRAEDVVLTFQDAAAMVARLDEKFGSLMAVLRSRFECDDFALFVTADRGKDLGERARSLSPAIQLSSAAVHVPLIIRYPGVEFPGRRSELSQSVDIAPTLLELFQVVPLAGESEGRSLLPSLRGEESTTREFAYLGASNGERAIRSSNFYLVEADPGTNSTGSQNRWLFAKPDDAWDNFDISSQHPDVADDMQGTLHRFFADTAPATEIENCS